MFVYLKIAHILLRNTELWIILDWLFTCQFFTFWRDWMIVHIIHEIDNESLFPGIWWVFDIDNASENDNTSISEQPEMSHNQLHIWNNFLSRTFIWLWRFVLLLLHRSLAIVVWRKCIVSYTVFIICYARCIDTCVVSELVAIIGEIVESWLLFVSVGVAGVAADCSTASVVISGSCIISTLAATSFVARRGRIVSIVGFVNHMIVASHHFSIKHSPAASFHRRWHLMISLCSNITSQ